MKPRGAIYHHKQLVFQNGLIGKKYLILLNSPSQNEPYLFVKTTSQKKDRPTTHGCIKKRSLFFIPAGKTFFKLDTWVQLFEIYPIPPKDIDTDKDITIEGSLDVKMIDDIVNCLLEAEEDNISPIFKKLLRPPIHDSLLKLKEKFDKSR
ncbi:MAG: hypothetical protein JRG87_07355 [Deltaproteobacteria bacterium]|nr:hypothetical protein [Deltaproteobacteria bacterium]MBW2156453.1 hypothetical protein [Deltaproteobacteria bacterium]